jgi:hypothetical protein
MSVTPDEMLSMQNVNPEVDLYQPGSTEEEKRLNLEKATAAKNALSKQIPEDRKNVETAQGGVVDLANQIVTWSPHKKEPRPNVPQWENSEEYKNTQISKVGMAAGFALMMVSVIGGAAAGGGKGAMKSLTSAMNGWKEGRDDVYKQGWEQYKFHVEQMKEKYAEYEREIDKINSDESKDLHEKLQAKRLVALSYGATYAKDISMMGKIDSFIAAEKKGLDKLIVPKEEAKVTLSKADLARIGVEYAQTNKLPIKLSNRKEDIGNRDAVEKAKTDALAYFEKNGKWPEVPTSTAKGMEYKADTSSIKKLTERNTMIQAFAETAEKNFETIVSESKKLEDMGKLPTFKSWANVVQAYQTRFKGDPDVIPYTQAVYETALEYAKVVQGNTGNIALSDSARTEMIHKFSEANSHATVVKSAEMSKKLINNRLVGFKKINDGLIEKYKTSPGKTSPKEIKTIDDARDSGWTYAGKSKSTGRDVYRDKEGKPHVF